MSHPGGQCRCCCEGEGHHRLGVEQAGPLESPRSFSASEAAPFDTDFLSYIWPLAKLGRLEPICLSRKKVGKPPESAHGVC